MSWTRQTSEQILSWALGGLAVLTTMVVTIWLLTIPALFQYYYPLLVHSGHTSDAVTVVRWLSSQERERTLNLSVTDRKLGSKELRHFADVRRVFQRLPQCAAALALLTCGLGLLAGRRALARVATHGLITWAVLLVLVGGLALCDWATFFAWAHRPLFGDRSWRLPNNAYSLQLFPGSFWRGMALVVLVAPGALLTSMALAFGRVNAGFATVGASNQNRAEPAERTPTIP
jgi:uncharacterized membrane protein